MEEPTHEEEPDQGFPWPLLASLACSLLIVVGGMLWTYGIWKDTNKKFHELNHVQESVQGLQAKLSTREARLP